MPVSVEQAFTNWPEIFSQIHDLFDRAPREAIRDPQALLARMALDELESSVFPYEVANEVRAQAKEVIAGCSVRDQDKIRRALAEPERLLKQLDGLVASMRPYPKQNRLPEGDGNIKKMGMDKWEAMSQVQNLLDVSGRFDKALSGISAGLRSCSDG